MGGNAAVRGYRAFLHDALCGRLRSAALTRSRYGARRAATDRRMAFLCRDHVARPNSLKLIYLSRAPRWREREEIIVARRVELVDFRWAWRVRQHRAPRA